MAKYVCEGHSQGETLMQAHSVNALKLESVLLELSFLLC